MESLLCARSARLMFNICRDTASLAGSLFRLTCSAAVVAEQPTDDLVISISPHDDPAGQHIRAETIDLEWLMILVYHQNCGC